MFTSLVGAPLDKRLLRPCHRFTLCLHYRVLPRVSLTHFPGGSLGWKTKESLLPEFSSVAFDLETSSTNSPKWAEAKTSEGYHIIMVEGRK